MVDEAQSTSEINKGTPEKIFDAARVQRWVNERTDRAERNARGQIARSLENDVRRAGRGNSFSIEEVQRRISSTKVDLEHLLGDKDRVSYKSKDSRTGGIVVAEVIRIAGGLVVQEVKPSEVDEKIVSRALIDQDKTELTLNYTGGDYEKNDANPGIIRSENYREATATTFNLLGKHIIRLSKTMAEQPAEAQPTPTAAEARPETGLNQSRLELKRADIEAKIKDGTDVEGKILHDGLKAALPELPGAVSHSYNEANNSIGKTVETTDKGEQINSGELNNAIHALRTFHRQIGSEKEYEVEIDTSQIETSEELSEEERQKLSWDKSPEQMEELIKSRTPILREQIRRGSGERASREGLMGVKEFDELSEKDKREKVIDVLQSERNAVIEKYRRKLIVDKVRADVALMPDLYADHELRGSGYIDSKARLIAHKEDLRDSLPDSEDPYRGEGLDLARFPARAVTRLSAFGVQEQADRRDWAEDRILDMVRNDDLTNKLNQARGAREGIELSEEDQLPSWTELPEEGEDGRGALITDRVISLSKQIRTSEGEDAARIFEHMDETRKRERVTALLQKEREAQNAFRELRHTAENSENATIVMEKVNIARARRLEVRQELLKIRSELVRGRTRNAIDNTDDVVRKLFRGQHLFTRNVDEQVSNTVEELGREGVAGFRKDVVEPVRTGFLNAVGRAVRTGGNVVDAATHGINRVTKQYNQRIAREGEELASNLRGAGDEINATLAEGMGLPSRERIGIRIMTATHRANVRGRELLGRAVERVTGWQVLGETEEDRQWHARKQEKITKASDRLIKRENWREINQSFVHDLRQPVETAPAETPTAETAAVASATTPTPTPETPTQAGTPPPESQPETKSMSTALSTENRKGDRPNLRLGLAEEEVVKYIGPAGDEHNIFVWSDGTKVTTEEVTGEGKEVRVLSVSDVADKDKAREYIDKTLKDLTDLYDKKGVVYEKGLFFTTDKEGKLIVTKEGAEGEFKFSDEQVQKARERGMQIKGEKVAENPPVEEATGTEGKKEEKKPTPPATEEVKADVNVTKKEDEYDGLNGLSETEQLYVEEIIRSRNEINRLLGKKDLSDLERASLTLELLHKQTALTRFNELLSAKLPKSEGIDPQSTRGKFDSLNERLAEYARNAKNAETVGDLKTRALLLDEYNKLLYERRKLYDQVVRETIVF